METTKARSGLDLKLARVKRGILQYELAAAAGLSPQRLSLIEAGRLQVGENQIERILAAMERLSG